jgi:hypothetical protein
MLCMNEAHIDIAGEGTPHPLPLLSIIMPSMQCVQLHNFTEAV